MILTTDARNCPDLLIASVQRCLAEVQQKERELARLKAALLDFLDGNTVETQPYAAAAD